MSFVDIFVALKDVCKYSSIEGTADVEAVMNSLCLNKIDLQEAINSLSEHLVNITNAEILKKYLSNLLLALVSAKIPLEPVFTKDTDDYWERRNHLENSYVLATLSDHPDILQHALKYFEINPMPPFAAVSPDSENYKFCPKKRRHAFHRDLTDKQIVACCHKLLSKLPNEFSVKWDWTMFINKYNTHADTEIRWTVKECMVIVTNMTEAQSVMLSKKLRVPEEAELKYVSSIKENIVRPVDEPVKDDTLLSVANVDGIMIPLYKKANVQKSQLVPVKSTVSNLRSLALAVASGKAATLLGPVGSGKTSLVEHLAAITGRKGIAFKKVQLGDQTDSRMLLGSHQCTDVPGEFIWRPGVLTEAVQNGHWLLLEDIDCAALDVASTLSSLLERNTLCVPGYRDALPVAPGFQLFVTQRTLVTNFGFQKKMSSSSTLLQKHLTQINVEPLSRLELQKIIQTLYPSLSSISARMIEVFLMFSVGSHDTSLQSTKVDSQDKENIVVMRGSRLISTRDLMKWCARAAQGFEVSSPESAMKVLQDALDIFTCSVSSPEHRLELSKKIGTCLGIVETKSEFYCKHHKPNVSLHVNSLEVGRAKVPRVEKSLENIDLDNKQVVFSFTRQSACLLEKIACCVTSDEPVLLVGETGTGKTSSVQYLARQTGHKLVVINMNQQSDSADLLGGYKPVDMKFVIKPMINEFDGLFRSFYNVEKNKKFLGHIETCYETENWTALLTLIKQSHKAAVMRLTNEKQDEKLKVWLAYGQKLSKLELQVKAASKLTFAFIEGSLVKAMQEGHWVLLDEINLASAEILECLAGLLEDKTENIELIEKGDNAPIKRHPDFTLFACMNPATDVGKKDLPVGLRNRFTEFFIDELTERNDLVLLIGDYLYHMNLSGAMLDAIYSFYASIRKEAKLSLVDGAGNAPHYSLRTLCRALTAAAKAKCGTVARSLYEAFCLSFLTQLDSSSHPKVEAMIAKAVLGKKSVKSVLNQLIPEPQVPGQNYLLFEGHWIPQGKLEIDIPEGYILTSTVRKNLRDIARIISLGRLPVLLQGDTSVGKTSLITYIAKSSGNYCVRINNHEHTDLQEYIGSYATDASGRLVFKEGVLVEAMRKGYWIILDELNLAPSDVLEALNRVLDDNRELFIPETQQVVKADPNFMLFATQNPPGLYGGRKMLSRAFRNRFVELHFDEIPKKELEIILHQRCHVPPAYSKKMIAVMAELQTRRRGSAAVQGKDGFITLRDLFRWGQRYKQASKEELTEDKFYDWDQHIADEGYLVLAGRVRQTAERSIIEEVIETHIKRKVTPDNLFCLHQNTSPVTRDILANILDVSKNGMEVEEQFGHVVWTYNMRRLGVLIAKAFVYNEPVLLVGETGCGKTTICQVLANFNNRKLFSVNCHMHTESSDFLGGLRPVRQYKNDGRLFEWVDGPLIKAMESGDMFLADEISLADDSVLERLNSLLEPERQLVLSERGMEENSDIVIVSARNGFHFVGTMNPGGDFGKKELSPALRNRFTEIWCDSITSKEDMLEVLERQVNMGISLGNQEDGSSGIGTAILEFTQMLKGWDMTSKFPFSIRDLLSWVQFINVTVSKGLLEPPEAYVHGACMTFLDCFGTALTGHAEPGTLILLREKAINYLLKQIETVGNECSESLRKMLSGKITKFEAETDENKFGIKPFFIPRGSALSTNSEQDEKFTFTAPTTGSNTLRLLRGLQLNKAILLEGNPGVGKTSLVTALAKSAGYKVVRINLSDQTDITDLFGTDLPTEDGSFTFKEGAFLRALQNGDWILLDELNLAPQPVLEGLNACLDHRGEVFIPELGKTFKVKESTKIFACQNPLKQGGARRGLPVSFLNRFTQVYIDTLTKDDLNYIVRSQYSNIPEDILNKIVTFNCEISREVTELQSWGHRGGPWEMNLRDIQRWCEAIIEDQNDGKRPCPGKFVDMLYVNRMRTAEDKEKMVKKYEEIFAPDYPRSHKNPQFNIDKNSINIGDVSMERNTEKCFKNRRVMQTTAVLLRSQMSTLKALAQSVKMNWLSILVGPTATGKSTIVQILADLTANDLHVVPVTSAMDVSDLLGGFEQVDLNRNLESLFDKIETLTIRVVRNAWLRVDEKKVNNLLSHLYEYNGLLTSGVNQPTEEMERFKAKVNFLLNHCLLLVEHTRNAKEMSDQVEKLSADLKRLEHKATTTSSVNAGGKFEWVDSLLVKSMIEGTWLLLDNVNLTSSAVLDRLNGLLEPNGVLSIPERGEFCEIKPHPNFRIFFTMDPKYGEISRAMRNRGVEIFLLKPDDFNSNVTDTMPYMDLNALLLSCDVPMKYHKIFVSCHELMSSYIQGLERPTIFHLMQAAHLTTQQMIRAVPFDVAFLNSFSDVYIKPRSASDFATTPNEPLAKIKNNMLKAIENKLKDVQVLDVISASSTLRIKELCTHSTQEIANQIAYSVIQVDEGFGYYKTTLIHTLYNVFIAYQRCPKEILFALRTVIDMNFSKRSDFALKRKMYSQTLNDMAYKHFVAHPDLVANARFYMEQFLLNKKDINSTNGSVLLLYNQLVAAYYMNVMCSEEGIKFVDYSRAIRLRNLTDDFSEYPLLRNCLNYIEFIESTIEQVLNSITDSLSDKTTLCILQLFNWKNRFYDIAFSPMFVRNEDSRLRVLDTNLLKSLYLHCKWVQKHLFQELFKLLPEGNTIEQDYNSRVLDLTGQNDQISSKSSKMSKKMRKNYGQPMLYSNQEQYELCMSRRTILKSVTLDLSKTLESQKCILTLDYSNLIDLEMAMDVPAEAVVDRIGDYIEKHNEAPRDLDPLSVVKMPFYSQLLHQVLYAIKKDLNDVTVQISLQEREVTKRPFISSLLINVVHYGKMYKVFTPEFLNLLNCMQKLLDGTADIPKTSLTHFRTRFWDEFYRAMASSAGTYPSPFFKMPSNTPAQEPVVPNQTQRRSLNLPLTSLYVANMTLSDDADYHESLVYEKVSIKEHRNYSQQLSMIQDVMWRNMGTLDWIIMTSLKSNAQFELDKYERLMFSMCLAVTERDIDITKFTVKLLAKCIRMLRWRFRESGEFIKMIDKSIDIRMKLHKFINEPKYRLNFTAIRLLTAQLAMLSGMIFVTMMAKLKPVDHIDKYRMKVRYIEEDIRTFEGLLGAYYIQGLVFGNISENMSVTFSDLTTEMLLENEESLKKLHPYCGVLFEMRKETMDRVYKYVSGHSYRPDQPTYEDFYKDCQHVTKTVLATKTTSDLVLGILEASDTLLHCIKTASHGADAREMATNQLRVVKTWLYSLNTVYESIDSDFTEAFPDLVKPYKMAMSQVHQSVVAVSDLMNEMAIKAVLGGSISETAMDLMKFPESLPRLGGRSYHLRRFFASRLFLLLRRNANEGDTTDLDFYSIQTFKISLLEVKIFAMALEYADKDSLEMMMVILSKFVFHWEKMQEEIAKKKMDEEALYVTKSKCEDEDEEAIAQKEIKEMFPAHSDNDFGDFRPSTLEQVPKPPEQNVKQQSIITPDDVTVIYSWHSEFVRSLTKAEWLPAPKRTVRNDVVSPLLPKYRLFGRVMRNVWEGVDGELETILASTLMTVVGLVKDKVDGRDTSDSKVDFYRSPWISEARTLMPLLQTVEEATRALLAQWPDFPTLKDIIVIIERIQSFPVTSPISRFLTGIELLRDKIEEWNKNAHSGNNMIEQSLAVGEHIIRWRKLEMSHWKECLNNLYQRKQSESHKYWFHMFNVTKMFLSGDIEVSELVVTLRNFIEQSNLVEFQVRLDLLYTFHCHLVHLRLNERRDELLSILWNKYNYYSQFSAQVAAHIKEKRTPIEKKLKDFVKICTWDRDLSYWSVKDTVDKAHKALHKHTKEFENVLKENVTSCLVVTSAETTDHVGIWDRPKRTTGAATPSGGAYMIDTQNFVLQPRSVKKYLDGEELPDIPGATLLSRVATLLNKARALCKDTIGNTGYPARVQALDDFVTVVIETSTHLGSLEVDAALPKDKQISHAKNIVQQKRKALSDLFKQLTKMGLNYRTGLLILSTAEGELYDFTIPPVDFEASLAYLKSIRCDASLSLLWSGCETYFQKNIARHRLLTAALQTPHQDLGMPNIERCKGFAAQLVKLTNTQKKSIAIYSTYLYDLRSITTQLKNIVETEFTDVNIFIHDKKVELLTECYAQCSVSFEQICVVLKSCPEKGLNDDVEFDPIMTSSPIVHCYKNSEEWTELYKKIKNMMASVSKQKGALLKLQSIPRKLGDRKRRVVLPAFSQSHIDVAKDSKENLERLHETVKELLHHYRCNIKYSQASSVGSMQHPLLTTLNEIEFYLRDSLEKLNVIDEPCEKIDIEESPKEKNIEIEEEKSMMWDDDDVLVEERLPEDLKGIEAIIHQSEDVMATMLLIIQSIYKKHLPQENSSTEILDAIDEIIDNEKDKESNEMLEDKHLKEHLQEKLSEDARMLQLETVISKCQDILLTYVEYVGTEKDCSAGADALTRASLVLEQLVLFVQYFVTQKVAVHRVTCKMLSVLLKIFSDLATKGFCKPSDLDMEEGEGEGGPGKLSGGTGLGDGEGQKDVSDRIENQDQLDDAHRPGEEKKDENKDCKEEEKGVNMSDDFDSHLQDVEKKEGDESDQDDEEDDADKQMGETDKAAEKLDQQIWGDEDEQDAEGEKNNKEEKGQGESTGEKEMGAKEEKQGTDDGKEGKERKEKKDLNEKDPEIDDDHIDPYHGNQQQMPEPEDFEMPDNMDIDGEDDDKDGETETENPFEIDVTKDDIPQEPEETEDDNKAEEGKDTKHGTEVSSDEEGEGDEDNKEQHDKEEETKQDEAEPETETQEDDKGDIDDSTKPDQPEDSEQPEETPEGEKDLPKNPEKMEEDDEVEQKNQEANPQAMPSNNDPTAQDKAENAQMDRGTDDNVETNAEQAKDEETAPFEQAQEQVGEETQSMGRSELDQSDRGHRGEKQAASRADRNPEKRKRHENKPGKTDQERTLGDVTEKKHKQMQTLNMEREEDAEEGGEGENDQEKDADAYQHVKRHKKDDLQAIDAATKEQAEQQPTLQQDDEEAEKPKEDEDIAMDVDDDELQVEKSEELKPEKLKEGKEKEADKSGTKKDGDDDVTGEIGVEVDGETVVTLHVPRGTETTFHTRLDKSQAERPEDMSVAEYMSIRTWVREPAAQAQGGASAWRTLWHESAPAARALCERLRLVLEPTGRSRRAGDFRTGRAINMRRVIPYIASHFRKDRIWLRRTKPARREYKIAVAVDDSSSMSDNRSKEIAFESLALVSQDRIGLRRTKPARREYKIAVAVDNSSSMSDNRSKEIAFESLALVSQALNLLESGDLAVLSFGEKPNLLHPFTEQFSEHSGSKILEQLRFEQTKTKIAQLLDFITVMFEEQVVRSDAVNAKLLVIVSDGRGIFSEGETRVCQAVRRARQQGIFLVYVIIDNPDNKDSIMDIRRPVIDPVTGTLGGFVPYLDTFPFPFYLILRDISALPTVLGDALRQWFELAANVAN